MRYVSLFSGIEAATVAWEPLGWEPLCFAEFDEFPSAVLAERYPNVPNVGDVTKVKWKKYRGKCDLVVGGSPCQSFSIAGKREGLQGESGLMFEYIRAVREVRPRWFLWENVPGALSSEGGEAFRQLLSEMDKLGYGLAWRVLDAQFFGVAQRRRRLFLVGRLGACPPVEVLAEPESLRGDYPSSREKREALAAAARRGASSAGFKFHQGAGAGNIGFEAEQSPTCTADWHNPGVLTMHQNICIQGSMIGRSDENDPQGSGIEDDGASFTLNCTDRHGVPAFAQNTRDEVRIQGDGTISGALSALPGMKQTTYVCETTNTNSNGLASTGCLNPEDPQSKRIFTPDSCGPTLSSGTGEGMNIQPSVAIPINEMVATRCNKLGRGTGFGVGKDGDPANTITCNHPHAVATEPIAMADMIIRRLTPLECERLQGFPDNHTRIPYRGKPADECPDGPRYKAIGNSMAVPVMRWIGERIAMADKEEPIEGNTKFERA